MTRNPNSGAIWLGKKCAQKHRFIRHSTYLSGYGSSNSRVKFQDSQFTVGLDLQKMKTIFAISLYLFSMIEGRKQLEKDGLHQRDLELAVKFPPQDRVQRKKQGS